MITATYWIDRRPGVLTFSGRRVAFDHMKAMIEFYGARMTLGEIKSCEPSVVGGSLRRAGDLLPPGGFLSRSGHAV